MFACTQCLALKLELLIDLITFLCWFPKNQPAKDFIKISFV